MTARDFAYWLQGYFEIHGKDAALSAEQLEIVKAHLNMVFIHEIDPSFPAEQQEPLNQAHGQSHAFQPSVIHRPVPEIPGLRPRC